MAPQLKIAQDPGQINGIQGGQQSLVDSPGKKDGVLIQ